MLCDLYLYYIYIKPEKKFIMEVSLFIFIVSRKIQNSEDFMK